jgi:hypothetical protein
MWHTGKAAIGATAILVLAAVLWFSFPNNNTFLAIPGVLAVYFLSGGVHGSSPIPLFGVWFYEVAAAVNWIIYFGVTYLALRLTASRSNHA